MKNKRLESTLARIPKLAPVTYMVSVQGTVAVALERYAMDQGVRSDTVIAEALRAYLGDM